MANNRLYFRDPKDGALLFFAKSDSDRWRVVASRDEIQAWLDGRDLGALEDDERPTTLELICEHGLDGELKRS